MTMIQFETSGFVFSTYGQLETTTCGVCGIPFAMPIEMLAWSRKQPHRTFYCPAGHDLHFPGKTEAEKLRDQLESERRYSANVVARLDQTEASLSATKGVVTKLKKRAANGVCPCCNRSFPKLHEHMKTKHPDYIEPEHVSEDAPRDETSAPAVKTRVRARRLNTDVERIVREKGPVSPAQIVTELGYSTANSVGVALHRLRNDGRVQRKGYGRWMPA